MNSVHSLCSNFANTTYILHTENIPSGPAIAVSHKHNCWSRGNWCYVPSFGLVVSTWIRVRYLVINDLRWTGLCLIVFFLRCLYIMNQNVATFM